MRIERRYPPLLRLDRIGEVVLLLVEVGYLLGKLRYIPNAVSLNEDKNLRLHLQVCYALPVGFNSLPPVDGGHHFPDARGLPRTQPNFGLNYRMVRLYALSTGAKSRPFKQRIHFWH